MRLPFAVDSLACARVAIMLIPSYTAAALANGVDDPDAGRRKRLGREPEAGPVIRQGQSTRVTPTTRVPKTTLTADAVMVPGRWVERRGGRAVRPPQR